MQIIAIISVLCILLWVILWGFVCLFSERLECSEAVEDILLIVGGILFIIYIALSFFIALDVSIFL